MKHHKALPIDEIGGFMTNVRAQKSMTARALEFMILTATRSGEVRGATWDEIDIEKRVWIIPAERMKTQKEHRVPLSDTAINILTALPRFLNNNLVFPSPRGLILSDKPLSDIIQKAGKDVVPHGFRSTFRDWCSERTNYPRDVAEMALAHSIGNAVEAAYRRGDLFEKRTRLMQEWANFINQPKTSGEIIPINKSSIA